MTTAYTTLLGLALPVQGELQGTWGDEVNNYITNYLDAAVAGTQTISGSQTAVTLSKTTGSSLSQAGSGATGSSQYFVINCTGNPAGTLTITAPAASKAYLIINATSTTQDVKIVGAGPTTGVTLVSGERAIVSWNGSDFVKVANFGGVGSFTTISATTGNITTVNSTTVDTTNLEVTNIKAKDGTASASIADSTGAFSVSAAFAANGNTTLGDAVGDLVTVNGTTTFANANPTLSAGTANGVLYLDGSKVATSGSALSFDGTGQLVVNRPSGSAGLILQSNDASTSYLFFGDQTSASVGRIEYDHSTNAMPFFANGSEQMRLTSTGLGIGTSSPGSKLTVSGDIQILSTNYLSFSNTAQQTYIRAAATSTLAFGTNSTEQMRLDSSGNLGIGTSSPGAKLDVDGVIRSQGSTGASSPRINLLSSGFWTWGIYGDGNTLKFQNDANDRLTLDSSGNLGLGVTPSAWNSGLRAIQVGYSASIDSPTSVANTRWSNNAFVDSGGGFKYINTAVAQVYEQDNNGKHIWYTAPSGTAGNAISFTQAMTLDASGNLGVGETSPSQRLHIKTSAQAIALFDSTDANGGYLTFSRSGTAKGYIGSPYHLISPVGSNDDFGVRAVNNLILVTGATERARITSGGNFKIGGTADRATTEGDKQLVLFDGTAPVGTLANGVSFYSASGEANVMDAAGNATLLSPHDAETNEWIFRSKHTPTGKVLKIDVERLLKFVNDHFGLDAVHEFIEP